MLEKSFGLFFFLKQPKNQKCNDRYVYLRITVDGISKELSTKRLWCSERWNQSSGRAAGTKEDAKALNVYLDTLCAKVYNAKVSLLEENKALTADALKNFITGHGEEKRMLLEIFNQHNDQLKALIGIDYVPGTVRRYVTTHDHVKRFVFLKYNVQDICITDLNFDFVSEFAYWLKSIRRCNHNSAMKYITNLKRIVFQCIRKGWLKRDPFLDFKTTRKAVNVVPLTQEEVNQIASTQFVSERLNHVRDIFLFSCYTGLSYVDVSRLKRSQLVNGVDGEKWIITNRQKTDSPTRLPLLPTALGIIDKYKDHPKCKDLGYALPVLSNQKMNAYLKEIGDLSGVMSELHFHKARHTFATTITLSNGVPLETVSKMLGHSSIKQTQHYAKLLDQRVSSDMLKLKDKLSTVNNDFTVED